MTIIYLYNSCRNRSNLTRSAIVSPQESAWKRLYEHADEQSFLTVTGFTRAAFTQLLSDLFSDRESPTVGRKPLLEPQDKLGLILLYLGSRMELKFLSLLFGVTPSTASRIVQEMLGKITTKLSSNHISEIRFPNQDEMAELAALVNHREPEITNVIGFVDGVSCPIQCSELESEQALNYNGYHHDTMCNNVLAFSAKGMVIYACVNYPGSWHDTHVAAPLIRTVIEEIGDYAMCVDQGFPRKGDVEGKLVGPLSKKKRRSLPIEERETALHRHGLYVSLRQAAEWGMRALQGTFTRLKSRMTWRKEARRDVILSCILLHNYRTSLIGLNQIQSVFDHEYNQFINVEGYERIARYFQ